MASTIDALVVELKIDTTDFDTGRNRTADAIRKFEGAATASATAIQGVAQRSVRDYLTSFEQQFDKVNQHLATLAEGSRRSAQSIKSGAEEGTSGLSNLVTTAAEAYASIKGLQGVYDKVVGTAASTAHASRLAQLTGLPIQYFSAYAQYVRSTSNVPEETTYGALNEFEQRRAAYRATGQYSDAFGALAKLQIDFSQPIPIILSQLSRALAGQHGPEAQFWATQVGLGSQVNALRQGPAALQQGISAHGYTAITPEEAESATRLQRAMNEFEIHIDSLWRMIGENVNPEMTEFINKLTTVSDWLSEHVPLLLGILNTLTLGAGSVTFMPKSDESWWEYFKRTLIPGSVRNIFGGGSGSGAIGGESPAGAGVEAARAELAKSGLSPEA